MFCPAGWQLAECLFFRKRGLLMQALRGTQDILPDQVYKWNYMERVIRHLCALYGYGEIRTPMFEDTNCSFVESVTRPM